MSNITEWIKYDLYPSLFEAIDRALPEHNFNRYAGGWRSKTYLNSSPHKDRADKTVVTNKAIGLIMEQGGEALSLIDYVMRRDSSDFIEATKTLAQVVNLDLPKSDTFNKAEYQNYKERATILEDCNSYFTYCLETSKNADEVKYYLSSRGYSSNDIKLMELGFIPSQEKLSTYLTDTKGHNKDLVTQVVKFNKAIGSTHRLTIPYRSGGSVKGFKFRTTGDQQPKYLNSTGLDKEGGFFNISGVKGDKDIVIVEGELDSLHATVKGVENVVATGGDVISSKQVRDAIRRGAKSFTLCFDKEPSKEEETAKRSNKAIDLLLSEGVNNVYIVTLPDLESDKGVIMNREIDELEKDVGLDAHIKLNERVIIKDNKIPKTDPDRLIKDKGVKAFKDAIKEATPYYHYLLNSIYQPYITIQKQRELTSKEIAKFLEEVVVTASKIKDPIHRDIYKNMFLEHSAIKSLGIKEESLTMTIDRLTSTQDKEEQSKELSRLLTKATDLQKKGQTGDAIKELEKRIKEVKQKDQATNFSTLLKATNEEEVRQRQANKPDSLNSGYTIGGEELLLPAGAISVLAAPTSHGKTTFLINLALNVADTYKDKSIYFFSYEEDSDSILINTLNTYLDKNLSTNNRRTLSSYFATNSTDYINKENRTYFKDKKDLFFKDLIESRRLNVQYCNYNSETLIQAIRYLHKETDIGAIFIDYIQLLNLPTGKYKTYSRQEELKQICIDLKDVAVETGLPLILGAQFNRTVTNQTQLHPTKIGEAGDIERIANLILGFWNNDFDPLGSDGEISEIKANDIHKENTLYTKILKQRGGRVGLSELFDYNGNRATIKNKETSDNNFFD